MQSVRQTSLALAFLVLAPWLACVPAQGATGNTPDTVTLGKTFVTKASRVLWSDSGHVVLAHLASQRHPEWVGSARIFDASGSEVLAITPHVDVGAVRFAIYSVSINPASDLVILSGAAQPVSGENYGTILFYSTQGVLLNEVRTGRRLPLGTAIDASGNVWVFFPNPADQTKPQDYKVLDCYSPKGVLLKQVLWRSQLPAQVDLGGEGPELGGLFSFGVTTDGIYIFIPQTHQLFEADFDGILKKSISILKPEMAPRASEGDVEVDYAMLDCLAVSRSGEVLGYYEEHFWQGGQENFAFGLFRLNRASGRWELLGEIFDRPVPGRLLGVTRNDKLVYLVRDGENDCWKLQFVSQ